MIIIAAVEIAQKTKEWFVSPILRSRLCKAQTATSSAQSLKRYIGLCGLD